MKMDKKTIQLKLSLMSIREEHLSVLKQNTIFYLQDSKAAHHTNWNNFKLKDETDVVVRPQLQTTGADAKHTGEKLIRCEELWDVKVLGQDGELFAQISRFLSERRMVWLGASAESDWRPPSSSHFYLFTFLTSSPSDRR